MNFVDRVKDLFWLKQTSRTEVRAYPCPDCEGYGLVWPDGTPYKRSPRDVLGANISDCRPCQGRGMLTRRVDG